MTIIRHTQPLSQSSPKTGMRPADCDGANNDDVPATCNRDTYTDYPIQQWSSKEMLYSENTSFGIALRGH